MQRSGKFGRILGGLWLSLLAAALVLSSWHAYRLLATVEEVAHGCDAFGYLQMAKEIRHAVSSATLPDFRLESKQTRLLIEHFKAQDVPVGSWHELVAPHAHHYFPRSDSVGVQYPPGTGLALALFPEGEAVGQLNRIVIATLLSIGLLALVRAGARQAWASAGLVVLALHLGLEILVRVGPSSFSIAAVLVPLALASALAVAAASWRVERAGLAWLAALGAGCGLGFAVLTRLPVLLLVPGFLILLWPRSWRRGVTGAASAFVVGLGLCGIVPALLNQQRVAGAWYLSTYSSVDAAPPVWKAIGNNLAYYLGSGLGSRETWALFLALAGFVGFAVVLDLRSADDAEPPSLSWRRLAAASAVIWTTSTVFFLTHEITTPYYVAPGTFCAVALLGFGALAIESAARAPRLVPLAQHQGMLLVVGAIAVLLPAVGTFERVWMRRVSLPPPAETVLDAPLVLPAELADERAWVYADLLTGSLWYYAHKPAFKIPFADAETRARVYRFAFERQEPQYAIRDSAAFTGYLDEIVELGGELERRGHVGGQPYFLIRWPPDGPAGPEAWSDSSGALRR